jgi:hypothetical protein
MAFDAHPITCFVLVIFADAPPVARVRVGPSQLGAVALDADITIRVAALARLQVAPCFYSVLVDGRCVPLMVGSEHKVRLDAETPLGEAIVAGRAIVLIVATVAGLRVVQRLYRVQVQKVTTVRLGHVIPTEIGNREVSIDSSSLVAVQAVRLIVALSTVATGAPCGNPVDTIPVSTVIRGNSFFFMTAVALRQLRTRVFFVRLFLRQGLLCVQRNEQSDQRSKC